MQIQQVWMPTECKRTIIPLLGLPGIICSTEKSILQKGITATFIDIDNYQNHMAIDGPVHQMSPYIMVKAFKVVSTNNYHNKPMNLTLNFDDTLITQNNIF